MAVVALFPSTLLLKNSLFILIRKPQPLGKPHFKWVTKESLSIRKSPKGRKTIAQVMALEMVEGNHNVYISHYSIIIIAMFSKEMTHYSYFPFCNKHSFNENTYDYQKVDISLDMTYYQKKSIKSICFIANVLCNLLYKKTIK